jgi:hypothetical protein
MCHVYVNSVLVADDATGCPDTLKVVVVDGIVYVGWSDGSGVFIAHSTDAVKWQVDTVFSGGTGVFGADFAVRSDGRVPFNLSRVVLVHFASRIRRPPEFPSLACRLPVASLPGFSKRSPTTRRRQTR